MCIRDRYSEPDDDDFEVLEVCDSSCTLSGWQTPDGSRPALAELPFDDEELCPPGALDDEEPDEQHFFEATGNEGASFERSYQRAALVLWPQAGKLKVIAGAGREVSLPYLVALTQRWVDSGEDKGSRSPLWNEAHQLARLMIARRDDWSTSGWMSASASGKAAPLLTALSQSEDTENIALFLAEVSSQGGYNAGDTEALTDAAMRLPASQAAALVERIITGNAAQQASACAEFLAAMAGRFLAQPAVAPSIALLEPAAQALVAALPGDPALAPAMEVWRRPLAVTPALVVDLLTALCHPVSYTHLDVYKRQLLQRWANEPPAAEEAPPEKLIYPLEHAYTPAEIGFPTLKGSDAAVASVLVPAAGRANCDLHLAFLAIRESGSAEYSCCSGSWSRSRRYSEPDDDYFEVLEVCDLSLIHI